MSKFLHMEFSIHRRDFSDGINITLYNNHGITNNFNCIKGWDLIEPIKHIGTTFVHSCCEEKGITSEKVMKINKLRFRLWSV